MPGKVWFFYRHPREGPRFLRVKELASPSVLAWFQDMWRDAPRGEPRVTDAWVKQALGGKSYGLWSLLAADVPTACSTAELERVLNEHLYVEGPPGQIVVQEQFVCVKTDDDDQDIV